MTYTENPHVADNSPTLLVSIKKEELDHIERGISDLQTEVDAHEGLTLTAHGGMRGTFAFSYPGALTEAPGTSRLVFPAAATLVGIRMACNTAPVGENLICDVHKNGTTIFTTQGNRPTIIDGAYATAASAVPDVTAVAAGDYLTVDIDNIGSGTAGSDLTLTVYFIWA